MKKKLDGVIQFAIDKEQEAVDFYNDLADRVAHDDVARTLRQMAEMETAHREKLENVKISDFISEKQDSDIPEMHIAEYIVEQQPTETMDWQDVIAIAMKREQAAQHLYNDLANLSPNPAVKELFQSLAKEEAAHKHYFEREWDDKVLTEN